MLRSPGTSSLVTLVMLLTGCSLVFDEQSPAADGQSPATDGKQSTTFVPANIINGSRQVPVQGCNDPDNPVSNSFFWEDVEVESPWISGVGCGVFDPIKEGISDGESLEVAPGIGSIVIKLPPMEVDDAIVQVQFGPNANSAILDFHQDTGHAQNFLLFRSNFSTTGSAETCRADSGSGAGIDARNSRFISLQTRLSESHLELQVALFDESKANLRTYKLVRFSDTTGPYTLRVNSREGDPVSFDSCDAPDVPL